MRFYDHRDQDVPTSTQSELRVLSNLVATGSLYSTGMLDEIFWEQMGSIVNILRRKKLDYNDLLVKCFSVIKKLLDNNGGGFGDSYIRHWVAIVELYKQVSSYTEDASGRLVYESITCITIIMTRVSQRLKASLDIKHVEMAINDLKDILDHAKASGVADALLSCLVTCGTSLMYGSSKLLRVACEAFEAIWSLINAFEIQSTKKTAHVFPLSSMYSHSLDPLKSKGDGCEPLLGKDYDKIVEAVTQAFLRSEAVRVATFYCLSQRLEASWSSVIQIILRCCLHNDSVTSVLCGVDSSSVVSGGGNNTIISEVFSILSLCASFDRDPQPQDPNSLKSKVSNRSALILHSCLFLATVAQSLESSGRNTAIFLLTSSPKIQKSRLSDLAHHYSFCDGIQNIQPHSMAAMLAFASILYLEHGAPTQESIKKIAFPLIPLNATLCNYRRIFTTDGEGDKTSKMMFSYWHGFRDGCVGLLNYRLRWAGPLDIQELGASDIPETLIELLGNKHSIEIGLSPLGVVWTIYSLHRCLQGGSSIFRQVLLTREHQKLKCDLISDVHLNLIRCWGGPNGGENGVRDTVNAVANFLRFPFKASVESTVLRNMESPNRKDMVMEIKISMEKYIQILLEVGFPGQIIKCLEHLELKDTATLVGLLLEMVVQRSLLDERLEKGLLNPNRIRRLLDNSSPTEVKMLVLRIVSELAGKDKKFYEHINGADILEQLKGCLTHEDPSVRALTYNAIEQMCRHSSYFYGLLATHNIINLLVDGLFDKDNYPRRFALYAICNIACHSDFFYEDLRKCIPQLANLLLSAETNDAKENAAVCLGYLSQYSDKLSQDMISKGAMEALLKLVADYSVIALDPRKIYATDGSPLYRALHTLARMCTHLPCRHFICLSDVYPVIGQLRLSPLEDIACYATLIFSRASEP